MPLSPPAGWQLRKPALEEIERERQGFWAQPHPVCAGPGSFTEDLTCQQRPRGEEGAALAEPGQGAREQEQKPQAGQGPHRQEDAASTAPRRVFLRVLCVARQCPVIAAEPTGPLEAP